MTRQLITIHKLDRDAEWRMYMADTCKSQIWLNAETYKDVGVGPHLRCDILGKLIFTNLRQSFLLECRPTPDAVKVS